MDKKIMNLTEISELKNISINYLSTEYEYRVIKGKYSARVNSSLDVIYYGKGKFIGSFLFGGNTLKRIILMPIDQYTGGDIFISLR